ncbi:hypothetical protein Aksp01_13410 [Akkermansia sp. NBRC 115031]|nr:hypothetical protein Aksp01_13410 [Akkermansia sp. NBRC 115031]
MVKEINEGGALTISSPSFPSGYYTVYRFVSSRGNVVQAFSVLERNQLQALGMALPVQVKAREELDEDVSWKLEREVVAMFSYGRSYMPHCEEVLVREAVYGPLSGAMVSHGGGGGFYGGPPGRGNGFAANQLKPSLPDNEASSKPSDDKETPVSPDRKPDGGTEAAGDEAVADSGKEELSLDSLLTENTVPTSSPDPKTLRLPASLKAEAVPEPSSAMLGMFGIACLLMRRKRS